jgi:peptidoglycan/LPS O-acetylase OafA/YrhL
VYRHAVIVGCFISSLILFQHAGKSHYFIGLGDYTAMLLIYFAAFYFFIFGSLKFIAVKPLLFLGSISYCVYLIHLTPGYLVFNMITEYFQWNRLISTLITITLVIGAATLITYAIERPVIRYLRKKFGHKTAIQVVPVPDFSKAV